MMHLSFHSSHCNYGFQSLQVRFLYCHPTLTPHGWAGLSANQREQRQLLTTI